MTFYEYYGRAPLHRYEVAEFEMMKEDGTLTERNSIDEASPQEWDRVAQKFQMDLSDPSKNNAVGVDSVRGLDDVGNRFIEALNAEMNKPSPVSELLQACDEEAMEDPKIDLFTEEEHREMDIANAVSGKHYNDVIPGYQYMQMMQYMLDGFEGVQAHLMGQIYKYLMRAGKKDALEQDLRKARWYLNCLIKYQQTGKIDVRNNDA